MVHKGVGQNIIVCRELRKRQHMAFGRGIL